MSFVEPAPSTASFKDFAALKGCRPSYVTELKKAGRLVLTDDGKAVRVAESLARIEATRDPAKAAVAARHAEGRGTPLAAAPAQEGPAGQGADDEDPPSGEESPDYQRWRARRERAGALREEMRLAEESGELLRRADAAAVVANAFTTLRTDLEALPDSIAPVLAAETDEARVRILLAEELEHALGNLSVHIGALGAPGV